MKNLTHNVGIYSTLNFGGSQWSLIKPTLNSVGGDVSTFPGNQLKSSDLHCFGFQRRHTPILRVFYRYTTTYISVGVRKVGQGHPKVAIGPPSMLETKCRDDIH